MARACSGQIFRRLHVEIFWKNGQLTPANTLVISNTRMPARGPSPFVDATDARHLRFTGLHIRGRAGTATVPRTRVRALLGAMLEVAGSSQPPKVIQ
jgi:hypothetical protein